MRRLFMPDSESPRNALSLVRVVLAVIPLLLAVDVAAGIIIPRLTIEPPFFLRFQNVQGVEKLWELADAGIHPVVFTGSSQLHGGVSPRVFNARLAEVSGKTIDSVNVSIWGSVTSIQQILIPNLLIPNHPQAVIYGIEMQALLPVVQNNYIIDDFINKPLGYALSRSSALERDSLVWLIRHSNLVGYRDNLREWLTAARPINSLGNALTAIDEYGHFIADSVQNREPNVILGSFAPFYTDDTIPPRLATIRTACQQAGVPCILLAMPLHELAYTYIPQEAVDLYYRVLGESGLTVWDFDTEACRAVLGDSSFYNLNHLNESGALLFSQMVADVYANVFYDVPITGDAVCARILALTEAASQ